jgi:predicted lipid-binding transport protein (Tim44 family)
LLIGLVVFAGLALFRFIARKRRPDLVYSHGQAGAPRHGDFARAAQQAPQTSQATSQPSYGGYSGTQGFSVPGDASQTSSMRTAAESGQVPAGFDTDGLIRTSKVAFVRLQAAWDKGDQGDIYEFTTPEMFAEIKMDLEARGKQSNRTDVVELDAQLLGVEEHGNEQLASVRFHGLIREDEGEAAKSFEEVWNFVSDARRDTTWRLAGIQQIA